jgi:hypothetical protein
MTARILPLPPTQPASRPVSSSPGLHAAEAGPFCSLVHEPIYFTVPPRCSVAVSRIPPRHLRLGDTGSPPLYISTLFLSHSEEFSSVPRTMAVPFVRLRVVVFRCRSPVCCQNMLPLCFMRSLNRRVAFIVLASTIYKGARRASGASSVSWGLR